MTNEELKEIIDNEGLEYGICEDIDINELDDVETYQLALEFTCVRNALVQHLEL